MLHPHQQMAAGAPDRVAIRRRDQAWLDARWRDPETRVLVVAGSQVRPGPDGGVVWVSTDQAPDGRRVLLGESDGRAWFAIVTDANEAADGWTGLRGLLTGLAGRDVQDAETPLVFHALGIAEWLKATRFCPRCGLPLEVQRAGHELVCANGHVQFPRLDPAVIMSVTSGDPGSPGERLLLGRQAVWPEGRYSTLAGFCEPGETLEDAVRREVLEETGVHVGDVEYFGNQPWPLPQSLMLGFLGRATTEAIALGDDELADARWVTREQLRAEAEAGTLMLPSHVSISRSLIEHWYGGPLPGSW